MIRSLPLSAAAALLLAACAEAPPSIRYDDPPAEPPASAGRADAPELLPLPGQLKPLPGAAKIRPDPKDPVRRVRLANAAAKIDPTRAGYINAMQVFPYSDGALYQIYVAPVHVTDIALEPGEEIRSVAAGDTVQWKIGDTESGSGGARQRHVLVKPVAADLPMNNLVILTDRRTYHLEAHPTGTTYMAAVSWRYPEDEFLTLRGPGGTTAAPPIAAMTDAADLRFRYAITGDSPPWRPVQVYDDTRKVFIRFPAGITQGDLPPLFVVGPDGGTAELVNTRVRGATMIVDRLFAAAELRLGAGHQQVVRITRSDGRG